MADILPTGPSFHKDRDVYKQDFIRGSNIVKEATEEYMKTDEIHKKEQLQKSMSEAIEAMNEILNDVLHKSGEKFEKKITDDYNNFISNSTPESMERLNNDIDKIKRSL